MLHAFGNAILAYDVEAKWIFDSPQIVRKNFKIGQEQP
jgi:hypothetical protein